MVPIMVAVATVIIVVVGSSMPVVIIGRVPGNRPVLVLHDAAPDKVTESRELLMRAQEQRFRNGHNLLIRDEAWVDAPCGDEELAVIIFGHHLRRGNLNAGT